MNDVELPRGWEVWSSEPAGPVVLAFRPDVFDGSHFPEACLPTIYVSRERDPRSGPRPRADKSWRAELRLEPAVTVAERRTDDRAGATAAARDLAGQFSAGEIAYRDAYQVPREGYLDRLDALIAEIGSDCEESAEREA